MSVDTFSRVIFASLHSGECIKDVISHCMQAFAYMGVPNFLKTGNGPAYASHKFVAFCKDHDICHKFGIPHNPTGQAIVERTHATLKQYFNKIKRGEYVFSPNVQLARILFILNFLTVDKHGQSAMERYWSNHTQQLGWVRWKDLLTG